MSEHNLDEDGVAHDERGRYIPFRNVGKLADFISTIYGSKDFHLRGPSLRSDANMTLPPMLEPSVIS
jgi:hypothetical protein